MQSLSQNFRTFYEQLSVQSLTELDRIYAQDVEFIDPVGTHFGLKSLHSYFLNLLSACQDCRFELTCVDETEHSHYVSWLMHYRHPRINGGRTVHLSGISQLRIEQGKICYQRDYYDLGAMLYEHVPLLGRLIVWMKGRLKA